LTSRLSKLFTRKGPREEDRVPRKLPVKVHGDEIEGVTRDLSPSGVYFEAESRFQVGSMIRMTIKFGHLKWMQLECEGAIVRVEDRGSKVGVGVRMNKKDSVLTSPNFH
jgi:hypothetical protein